MLYSLNLEISDIEMRSPDRDVLLALLRWFDLNVVE